jgi:thioredoxin 1
MMEYTITTDNFEQEVLGSELPVLVDFWAPWCGPCRMIAPVLEGIAKDFEGKIKIAKVNIDEQMPLAAKYKVSSIPTLMLFEKGEGRLIAVGYKSREELLELAGL